MSGVSIDIKTGEITTFAAAPVTPTAAQLAAGARAARDARLQACDWTQVADCPLYQNAAWLAYRQALRDIPQQAGFPDSVVWPVAP